MSLRGAKRRSKPVNKRRGIPIGAFASSVYQILEQIPCGKVTTYAAIARVISRPRAARAVGNALRKNPHPVVVPCHRVVRNNGRVGGYAHGVKRKIVLLRNEGIRVCNGRVDKNVIMR